MKDRGLTTSLDTNDDPEGKWGGVLEEVLSLVDLLLCTEQELVHIAKVDDLDEAANRVAARVPLVVVKRGPLGASAYSQGQRMDVGPLQVTVTDTVGAGDTFDAGFLHQWVRNAPLKTCVAYGNLAGALSVTRSGGTEAFRDSAYREHFLEDHWKEDALVP
jgi:sugar/nucleoside kinase (ribokinase family)